MTAPLVPMREALEAAASARAVFEQGDYAEPQPKVKRNGKYRHGGFTTEAIDERRRLAALIRDSRDFMRRATESRPLPEPFPSWDYIGTERIGSD
jgi:hypothetical protein